jgi:acyl-CoA thioesterase FadM
MTPGDIELVRSVSAKFLRPITPPANLTVSARPVKADGEEMKFKGVVLHDEEKCAESTFIVKVLL